MIPSNAAFPNAPIGYDYGYLDLEHWLDRSEILFLNHVMKGGLPRYQHRKPPRPPTEVTLGA